MPFTIVRNDITKMKVDAIVNAANTELLMGGGVCGAIFKAAGEKELQEACKALAPIKTGSAVITPGFQLPAKWIIHTAGPVYQDGKRGEPEQLAACYENILALAYEKGCQSMAFPLISSGIYGYPKEEALKIAKTVIGEFLQDQDMDVFLVVFDKEAVVVSQQLVGEVQEYIKQNYVDEHEILYGQRRILRVEEEALVVRSDSVGSGAPSYKLEDLLEDLDEPFSSTLLRLVDKKGKKDTEVYRKANIDRKLFSKIRSEEGYHPSKRTAIALAIALELNLIETEDLLRRAGYALSHSNMFDVIIEFFIVNKKYDIFEINEVLFQYDQLTLGG